MNYNLLPYVIQIVFLTHYDKVEDCQSQFLLEKYSTQCILFFIYKC